MLEKRSYIVFLNDFYGPLLTQKQQDAMSLHYENDWSLAEIAEHMQITRQAVHDILKRAETALQAYENRLGLAGRFLKTRQRLQEVCALLENSSRGDNTGKALLILQEINEML
ncbi:MAG: YlxM family DNA-binding protein [Syntrophomonadaceae bacterium]|nr:YlxM family DNA-binding protein [Syntrophomonadaceae bacterium]MDD3270662.1 YlxM family DNA-binding protein [Syntrophomonadaceae bacterium]MDD3898813.1 YlxM family DNA-binding protein [Syntrophomonadaceae bacterium]MDD4561640.1 YlxM family DNA-binding protein [Syntrophomonadaceae bacterium]